MPKTKFTAKDKNGTIHTRTSDRREYTHTVVYLPSFEQDMACVDSDWKTDGSNFDYYTLIAGGNDPLPCRNYRTDPARWTAEEIAAAEADAVERQKARIDDASARVMGKTRQAYIAEHRAERVARIHAKKAEGYYGIWQNAGWCGRLDLAHKLAASKSLLNTDILVATKA